MTLSLKLVKNNNATTPVFRAGRFNHLTQQQLNKAICHLLQQGEINQDNFASHSFQIGAATTAAVAGLLAWLIKKTLGLWNSNAYLLYIYFSSAVFATVSHIPANADPTYQLPLEPDL